MASKTLTLETPVSEAGKYQAAVKAGLAEVDRILRRLDRKQARIDRLRTETRAILTRLKED